MLCRLKSLIGRLSPTSFSGENYCPESYPLFYRKTAFFSPAIANLYYERLWTQHGGEVLRISGFYEDGDNKCLPTRCEGRYGDGRSRKWFHLWDQVHSFADYVFVDAETWAEAPVIDGRFVRVNLLTRLFCSIRSKQYLRARKTPLSGGVALTATETSTIQFCLHSVRENMKLLESPEKKATASHTDDSVIRINPDKRSLSWRSVTGSSANRRPGRHSYRIAKRSPCTPTSDYFLRRRANPNGSGCKRIRLTPDATILSEFPAKSSMDLVKEIPETEMEDETTLVADSFQTSKIKDGSVGRFERTLRDTIYVASISPVAIAAGKLAIMKSEEPLCDAECEKSDVA
ncbi:hypothetical protein V1509DRAFT_566006 [Lipomyces kononenkoae]